MKMNYFHNGTFSITSVNRTSLCITICPAVHSTNNPDTGGAPGATKPSHSAGVVAEMENEIENDNETDANVIYLVPM